MKKAKNVKKGKIKNEKKPFFAKLLESQKVDELKKVKGGVRYMTHKWPSDDDEP